MSHCFYSSAAGEGYCSISCPMKRSLMIIVVIDAVLRSCCFIELVTSLQSIASSSIQRALEVWVYKTLGTDTKLLLLLVSDPQNWKKNRKATSRKSVKKIKIKELVWLDCDHTLWMQLFYLIFLNIYDAGARHPSLAWMSPSRCEQSLHRVSQTTGDLMQHISGGTCAGCPLGGGAWESESQSADCPLPRRNNKHDSCMQCQELHETESVSALRPRGVSPPLHLGSRLTWRPQILSEASPLFFNRSGLKWTNQQEEEAGTELSRDDKCVHVLDLSKSTDTCVSEYRFWNVLCKKYFFFCRSWNNTFLHNFARSKCDRIIWTHWPEVRGHSVWWASGSFWRAFRLWILQVSFLFQLQHNQTII